MAAKILTAIGALLAAIGLIAVLGFPNKTASAQGSGERYLVTPIDGGIMRVDRYTGEVSTCTKSRGKWACELVPDDRLALEREIDELEDENARLSRKRGDRAAQRHSERDRREAERHRRQQMYDDLEEPGGFMSPEEVDSAMSAVDRMMRRFMETARRIRRQMTEGEAQ